MATRGRRRQRCPPASSMKRQVRRRACRSASGVIGSGWWRTEGRWFSSKQDVGIGTRGIALGFDMVAGGGGGADVVDMVISGTILWF
mmetsp:Transcript_25352/g.50805  ORF Transcript_25352/g.50805 Transcript_25352/m.50805 type:complete len:87 (+) Transcript_25352:1534-1794(+)